MNYVRFDLLYKINNVKANQKNIAHYKSLYKNAHSINISVELIT